MKTIQFLKKAFSKTTDFSIENNPIGYAKFDFWDSRIEMYLDGKKYELHKKGFWKQGFYVLDNQQVIAEIEFATWSQKIMIRFDLKTFLLIKSSFWSPKYDMILDDKKIMEIRFTSQFWGEEGYINFLDENSDKIKLVALIGQVAINIQRRRAAAAAASVG